MTHNGTEYGSSATDQTTSAIRMADIGVHENLPGELITSEEDAVQTHSPVDATVFTVAHSGLSPRIVTPRRRVQCVPYARRLSGIAIRGDARTWWRSAAGRFERANMPSIGAVMVMKPTRRIRLGHVAVVTRVLSKREIVVNHANWLNRKRIHLDSAVIDVSPNNDWSAVRVWYTPGRKYGSGVYPTYGFINRNRAKQYATVANANIRRRPSTRAHRVTTVPRQTRLEVVEKVSGVPWYRVARRGRVLGYVYAPLVQPIS